METKTSKKDRCYSSTICNLLELRSFMHRLINDILNDTYCATPTDYICIVVSEFKEKAVRYELKMDDTQTHYKCIRFVFGQMTEPDAQQYNLIFHINITGSASIVKNRQGSHESNIRTLQFKRYMLNKIKKHGLLKGI